MCIVGLHAGMQHTLGGVNVGSICVSGGWGECWVNLRLEWVGLMLGHFPSRVDGANVGSICVSSGRKDVQSIAI